MLRILSPFLAAFVIYVCHISSVQALTGYWHYQEYLDAHPDQQLRTDLLSELVRNPPQKIAEIVKNPVTISVIYPGQQASDYWSRNIKAFKLRLDELGIEYTINQVFSKPNQDNRQQSQSLLNALKSNPDYLIFTLDTARHRKFIEHALSSSKTKLILQNITTPVKQWGERQPFMYLGFDHEVGSKKLAHYFSQQMSSQQKNNQSDPQHLSQYSILYFSPGYVSEARGDTFLAEMHNVANTNLVSSFYTDATVNGGYKVTLDNVRNNPQIEFIYACSTDVALGAIKALKELGRTDILINGWGGGSAELSALVDGELAVTVMRMNDDTGIAMAEAIKLDLTGHDVPLLYSGDLEILSKNDGLERIEQLKQHAFRYSDRE